MKYINYLKSRNLSNNTIKAYLLWSEKWNVFLNSKNPNKTLLAKFIKSLQNKKMKPATIHLAYFAVKNYLQFKKYKFVFYLDIKLPKQIEIKRTIIEREVILNELDKLNLLNFYERRLFTIIYILLNTGIRAFELINLKWENFDQNKILINGKGNKFRYVYINESFFKLINFQTKGYVIKSLKNKKISQKQLNLIVREFSKKIGIYFTPHDLRRSFCTHLIRNNCNIKIIQMLMGHSNIAVTSRYICLTESEIFNAYNNIFN